MHFLLCSFCYAVLALVLSTWLLGIHSMKNNFRIKNKNKLYKNNILVTKIYLHISKTFLAWISSYFRRLNWSDLRIKFSVENLLTLYLLCWKLLIIIPPLLNTFQITNIEDLKQWTHTCPCRCGGTLATNWQIWHFNITKVMWKMKSASWDTALYIPVSRDLAVYKTFLRAAHKLVI